MHVTHLGRDVQVARGGAGAHVEVAQEQPRDEHAGHRQAAQHRDHDARVAQARTRRPRSAGAGCPRPRSRPRGPRWRRSPAPPAAACAPRRMPAKRAACGLRPDGAHAQPGSRARHDVPGDDEDHQRDQEARGAGATWRRGRGRWPRPRCGGDCGKPVWGRATVRGAARPRAAAPPG